MDPDAPTQVPGSPDAYAPTSPAPASPDAYAPTAMDDVKDVKNVRHGSQDDADPDAPTQVQDVDDDDEVEERQSVAASDDDEPEPPASPQGSDRGSKQGR